MNFRVLPPSSGQTTTINGRSYSAAVGSFLDVVDADAAVLTSNGWTKVCLSGPTSARPQPGVAATPPYIAATGLQFCDTTIATLVIFDGATWRTVAGVAT